MGPTKRERKLLQKAINHTNKLCLRLDQLERETAHYEEVGRSIRYDLLYLDAQAISARLAVTAAIHEIDVDLTGMPH